MSYQGGPDYMGVQTVDEVAEYTDMMGQASIANQSKQGASWRNDPTKALIVLWGVSVTLYFMLTFFFRRYAA